MSTFWFRVNKNIEYKNTIRSVKHKHRAPCCVNKRLAQRSARSSPSPIRPPKAADHQFFPLKSKLANWIQPRYFNRPLKDVPVFLKEAVPRRF